MPAVLRRGAAPEPREMIRRANGLVWTSAAKGVTLLCDAGIGMTFGADEIDQLREALPMSAPLRCRGFLASTLYHQWTALGMHPGIGDDNFRINGIKGWSDGSGQSPTAFSACATSAPIAANVRCSALAEPRRSR